METSHLSDQSMTDPCYRALCAELLSVAKSDGYKFDPSCGWARAALSAPAPDLTAPPDLVQQWQYKAPGAPTIQPSPRYRELWLIDHAYSAGVSHGQGACPAIHPVSVIERLPGLEDCDAKGACWWFDPQGDGAWGAWYVNRYQGDCTHWLPASALPTPGADRLPTSLKEQAMRVLVGHQLTRMELDSTDIETIRRALEALPND
jgi:hypothetical protein